MAAELEEKVLKELLVRYMCYSLSLASSHKKVDFRDGKEVIPCSPTGATEIKP
jgi:hypothetical protein